LVQVIWFRSPIHLPALLWQFSSKMRCTSFLTSLLFIALACGGHAAEEHSVIVTAGGEVEPASPIMRKHAEDGAEHHHKNHRQHHTDEAETKAHHTDETKAMFSAMDLNEDGLVSAEEVTTSAHKTGSVTPQKDMLKMLRDLDTNGDGGISYAEFLTAAKDVQKKRVDGHHLAAAVNEHRGASELERADQVPPPVSCGGHTAPNCASCTTTAEDGGRTFNHLSDWCNGDCVYGTVAGIAHKCHEKGTVTIDGTLHGSAAAGQSTSPVPDLLNPALTDEDKRIIEESAREAVRQEQLEKDGIDQEDMKSSIEKTSLSNFWFIVIISFSVILGLCAITSLVAILVFLFMPKPEMPMTKEELLAEEVDSGADEGEGEGEEAGEQES